MLTDRQTPRKILVSFCALLAVSCAQSQKVAVNTNTDETTVSSTPPFPTKEPTRYRATRTITTVTTDGRTTVTKYVVARDGEWRRYEPEMAPERMAFVSGPGGRFLLFVDSKAFVDLTTVDQAEVSNGENDSDSSPDRLLHTDPIATSYQKIGTETVNGRTTQKYRAVVNRSPGANVSANETLIWVDETLQMPIKTETESRDGTSVTTELTDISLDVTPALFQIPEGYKKTTLNEYNKGYKKFREIGKP